MDLSIAYPKEGINESFLLGGDKSVAHRSLIIGALPKGKYTISNFPNNLDCLATLDCMKKLGVKAEVDGSTIYVDSPGYKEFDKTPEVLNAENSGTTVRLMSGLLSGCGIKAKFVGDASLSKRPMKRVINPLSLMGASIHSNEGVLPLEFYHNEGLKAMKYDMEVPSAQVKSCVLIAGFLSEGMTTVNELVETRDHTERMFKYLGADINKEGKIINIKNSNIECKDIYIPGDISSAAFLICTALLIKDAYITIERVLLNKGRSYYIDILKKMGADITVETKEDKNGELVGDIKVKSSKLKAIKVKREEVPNIIDEIPVLAVLASFAEGTSVFEGVEELKYKESDRIEAVIKNLNSCKIRAEYINDNLIVYGNESYIDIDANLESFKDHRIALSFMVLAARNKGKTNIKDFECTHISFPKAKECFEKFFTICDD